MCMARYRGGVPVYARLEFRDASHLFLYFCFSVVVFSGLLSRDGRWVSTTKPINQSINQRANQPKSVVMLPLVYAAVHQV